MNSTLHRVPLWQSVVREARNQPSAILLLVQLLGIIAFPWVDGRPYGNLAVIVISACVLGAAVVTVRSTPALTWVSYLFGLPALLLEIFSTINPDNEAIFIIANLMLATFYFYTAYALIAYVFDDASVSTDELFAVGAAFTVIAWAFAYLFMAIQVAWPGSFVIGAQVHHSSWLELLYLSIACLTSVGLSDIMPALPHARSTVILEHIGGVFFVAMVISRIVALTVVKYRGVESDTASTHSDSASK